MIPHQPLKRGLGLSPAEKRSVAGRTLWNELFFRPHCLPLMTTMQNPDSHLVPKLLHPRADLDWSDARSCGLKVYFVWVSEGSHYLKRVESKCLRFRAGHVRCTKEEHRTGSHRSQALGEAIVGIIRGYGKCRC